MANPARISIAASVGQLLYGLGGAGGQGARSDDLGSGIAGGLGQALSLAFVLESHEQSRAAAHQVNAASPGFEQSIAQGLKIGEGAESPAAEGVVHLALALDYPLPQGDDEVVGGGPVAVVLRLQ